MANPIRYCVSCGEDVPVYEFITEKGVELRCSYCGFTLDWKTPDQLMVQGDLVIADDSKTLATLIRDFFADKGDFRHIYTAHHGGQVLEIVTDLWKKDHMIELIILDVKMPVLNGAQCAIALRWIERGFGFHRKTPIIFLSAYRASEDLKKVIEYCQPSHYLNKGKSEPEDMLKRLYTVASNLIKEKAEE